VHDRGLKVGSKIPEEIEGIFAGSRWPAKAISLTKLRAASSIGPRTFTKVDCLISAWIMTNDFSDNPKLLWDNPLFRTELPVLYRRSWTAVIEPIIFRLSVLISIARKYPFWQSKWFEIIQFSRKSSIAQEARYWIFKKQYWFSGPNK
jgi:hypothetical protein